MKSAKEHYETHLAPVYEWMVGGGAAAIALGDSEIEALGLPARAGDAVLDLGAGLGMHAIPLARRGAQVTAVDASLELLDTLRRLGGGLQIQVVGSDILAFLRQQSQMYAAIVCMGDTLTHFETMQDIETVLSLACKALLPGGVLVLSFRDYTSELRSEGRFIPVRSDGERILTCFLEYGPSSVAVHDILHEKTAESWQMRVSTYKKLCLEPSRISAALRQLGFDVRQEPGLRGMVRLVATNTADCVEMVKSETKVFSDL